MNLVPGPNGTPLDLITAVRRVNKVLRRYFDFTLYEMGISYAQYEVLLVLHDDANLHAAAIARQLKISPQAVQKLLDKLLAGGLIEVLPPDGGVMGVRISRRGRTRMDQIADALGDADRRIHSLPIDLRRDLVEGLQRVERALWRPHDGKWL